MVIAYHLIFTAYGWWLPNDPRGSTSRTIRNDVIADLGDLHYGRKRVQPNGAEIREFYDKARSVLKHDLRTFGANVRIQIADSFSHVMRSQNYTCYACAIMPDHVHLLIRKHRDKAEKMIVNLQEASRLDLAARHGYSKSHPVWGGPGWKVFLNTADDIERTIRYIERNPIPYRLPVQIHEFVTPYNGWDLQDAAK